MATKGSFNTTTVEGRYLTFSWSIVSQDVTTNKTKISWSLKGGGVSGYVYGGDFKVVINGSTVYTSETRIPIYNSTTIKTGTATIAHNNDGTKTFSASVECALYSYSISSKGSDSWALTAIPRQATITLTGSAKTETSISVNWKTDATVDRIRYKVNNSSWSSAQTVNAKSGAITITSIPGGSALNAGTTYSIVVEARRKDSGLTSTSKALSVKTYSYPYCKSTNDFRLINSAEIYFSVYNPLARTYRLDMVLADDTVINVGEYDTDSPGIANLGYLVTSFYESIPNAKSAKLRVKVTYDSHETITTCGTYTIVEANCYPLITPSYADINETTKSITGDDQLIVQSKSRVRYGATLLTKYSATVATCTVAVDTATYDMTVSGDTASVEEDAPNSSTDLSIVYTVTDSRGLTTSQTVTMKMLEWFNPYAKTSLQRRSNFYSTTDLKVNAEYASINGNNRVTIRYRIKKTDDPDTTWSTWTTIQDDVTASFEADNLYDWDVEVEVTDLLGGLQIYYLHLPIGMPIIFFDRILRSTGINCFPWEKEQFAVNGVDVLAELRKLYYEPGDTMVIEDNVHGGVPLSGYITATKTTIRFAVPVEKSLEKITTITCTECTGGIRGVSGYVNGSRDSTDWVSDDTITFTITKVTDRLLQVEMKKSSEYSGATNNTPLIYSAVHFELEFN